MKACFSTKTRLSTKIRFPAPARPARPNDRPLPFVLTCLRAGIGLARRAALLLGLCAALLAAAALPAQAQVPQNVITTNVDVAWSVYAADLTGSGNLDVLSASFGDDKIAWYENNGDGTFSEQKVITTDAAEGVSVYAADLTGNGDLDVLSASRAQATFSEDPKIAWYENNGDGTFSEQKVITTDATNARSVFAADLTGSGDLDVLFASAFDDKIAWHENNGDGTFSEQKVITTNADKALDVHAADLTGNGNLDVLSASFFDDKIAWYENNGDGTFSEQKVITTDADGAWSVYAADLTGNDDLDVLSASQEDNKVAWYENQGGSFSEQKVITTDANGTTSVYAADVDEDGDADALSAFGDKIAWYENQGGSFSEQRVVTTEATNAVDVHSADLTGDGDPDLLSAGDEVAWYQNTAGALPVELASLTARFDGSGVRLTWQTASETNNAGFEVQRRAGENEGWTQVGYVESKADGGTTTEAQSYSYTADDLPVGTHQFRLRQVDLDGSSTLIDPVTVDIQMQEALKLTAPAPNPARSAATLSFAIKEQSETTIQLYNTLGQQVATLYEGTPQAGERQTAQVDAGGLPSGTYFVRLQADGQTRTRRLTVVR